MPEKHALLSASSASRWLRCTAAPRFEQQFEESTSEYAEEGRLAHSFCELKVLKKFTASMNQRTFTAKMNKLKKDERYSSEMDKTSDLYVEHLTERAMQFGAAPYVAAEVRVDYSDYVPEGFGTCDCVMIGGDTIIITDYKHGKGIPVSAENNPQMKLYALGALRKYRAIYGESIKKAVLIIEQLRLSETPSVWETTVHELISWGNSIKPIAEKAYMGLGEFVPGEHCRFCRGKAQCKARASQNTALEEFKGFVPAGRAKPGDSNILTDAEVGELLTRGAELVKWYKDLEEYALEAALKGANIEGWKAVAGRSVRSFSDTDKALEAIRAAGYDDALLYERRAKSLTELEKLMGKKEFEEKVGAFVVKPVGKPTLAPLSDKREPYSSAAADFAAVKQ